MALSEKQAKRNAYGEELRERRERAGLTQAQLGKLAVLSRSHAAPLAGIALWLNSCGTSFTWANTGFA